MVRLLAGWLPRGTNVFEGEASPPPAVSAGAAAASGDELADIDLALSLAVTGPSESWNLAPLRDRLRLAATRATAQGDISVVQLEVSETKSMDCGSRPAVSNARRMERCEPSPPSASDERW
jgi:hypothetical protein